MGIDHDVVYESLQNPENTRMRVTYQLLVDNRHLSEKAANGKIQVFFAPSPPTCEYPVSL